MNQHTFTTGSGSATKENRHEEKPMRVVKSVDADVADFSAEFDLTPEVQKHLRKISDFSAQYLALRSLQEETSADVNASSPWKNRSPTKSTNDALQNYTRGLREFQESQIESLAAGMFNVEEETSEDLERKQKALKNALHTDDSLNNDMLEKWYGLLSGKKPKGPLETNIVSCPAESIEAETEVLIMALESMEKTCLSADYLAPKKANKNLCLKPLSFALTAFFACETIKPNRNIYDSQLSQVVLTWALQRCGIPLLALMYQTPRQKVDFIFAMEKTRKNICFAQNGKIGHLDWQEVLKRPGLLSPLLSVLVNCLSSAVDEFGNLVAKKDHLATEEAEAKAIRRARELQASEGSCIICLDTAPNMATLCCGKTVHLNCIAEWLQNHTNCPQCRNDLPSMKMPTRNRFGTRYHDDDSSEAEDSMVGELLTYLANEATDNDSSSSSSSEASSVSSSSSSSSSSSDSSGASMFSYSAIHWRINYGSTDEDEHETDDPDLGYEEMLNDPDIVSRSAGGGSVLAESDVSVASLEPFMFHPRQLGPTFTMTRNDQFAHNEDDHDFNTLTQGTDSSSTSSEASSERGRNGQGVDHAPQDTQVRTHGNFPRLSFLDPSLLGDAHSTHDVQHVPTSRGDDNEPLSDVDDDDDDDDDSDSQNNSSQSEGTDGESSSSNELAMPLVPRHFILPEQTSRSLARQLAELSGEQHFATTRAPWLLRDNFAYESDDGYDGSGHSSSDERAEEADEAIEDGYCEPISPTTAEQQVDSPTLCVEENCQNCATRECCNKRCGRCCRLHSDSCLMQRDNSREEGFGIGME